MIKCVGDLSSEIIGKYTVGKLIRLHHDFLGIPVEIRSNSPEMTALLQRIYGAFQAREGGEDPVSMFLVEEEIPGGRRFLVSENGFSSFICSDASQALSFWGAQLMGNHVYRSGFLFLHASVLSRESGAAVFLGGSHAGKTSLTLRLQGDDFILFSDEFAPLQLASGKVSPFPRSFLLRRDSLGLISGCSPPPGGWPFFYDYQEMDRPDSHPPKRFIVAPDKLFPQLGREPETISALFFLDGFSDRETMIRPLPAAAALKMIIDHSVNLGYLTSMERRQALSVLLEILETTPAFSLTPGPLTEAPEALRRAVREAVRDGRPDQAADLKILARRCGEIMETWKYKNNE